MTPPGDDESVEVVQVPLGEGEATFALARGRRVAQLRALQAAMEAGDVPLDLGRSDPRFAAPPWHPDHIQPDE